MIVNTEVMKIKPEVMKNKEYEDYQLIKILGLKKIIKSTEALILHPSLSGDEKMVTKIGLKSSILLEANAYKVLFGLNIEANKLDEEMSSKLLSSEFYISFLYYNEIADDELQLFSIDIEYYGDKTLSHYLYKSNFETIEHEFSLKENSIYYVKKHHQGIIKKMLAFSLDFYKQIDNMNKRGYFHHDIHANNVIVNDFGFKLIDFEFLTGEGIMRTFNATRFQDYPTDLEYCLQYITYFIYCCLFYEELAKYCLDIGIVKNKKTKFSIRFSGIEYIANIKDIELVRKLIDFISVDI